MQTIKRGAFTLTLSLLFIAAGLIYWLSRGTEPAPNGVSSTDRGQDPVYTTQPPAPGAEAVLSGNPATDEQVSIDEADTNAANVSKPKRPLEERMRFDTDGLERTLHPDGRKSLYLQGRFLHMAITAIDEDGNKIAVCTSDHDHVHDTPALLPKPRHASVQPEIR